MGVSLPQKRALLTCATRELVKRYVTELREAGFLTVKMSGLYHAFYMLAAQSVRTKNVPSTSHQMSHLRPIKARASLYESKLLTQERVWPKPVQRAETLNEAEQRTFWDNYEAEMSKPLIHKDKRKVGNI